MSSGPRMRLLPSNKCFFNESIRIKVEGLTAGQSLELRARLTDDKGVTFKSSGIYNADQRGEIDLDNHSSLGGSYTGVEPMGLFWSLRPETSHCKLWKRDVLSELLVEIELHDSEKPGTVLARETNVRGFMGEGLRRIPVKEGRIRGVLFLPPGPGPFPCVIQMYTLGGHISEITGCLLANEGFVVMSLAYYGYEDLPKDIKKFDLEYFEEAVMFMRALPEGMVIPGLQADLSRTQEWIKSAVLSVKMMPCWTQLRPENDFGSVSSPIVNMGGLAASSWLAVSGDDRNWRKVQPWDAEWSNGAATEG
ncbi:hypothetical protein GJAV_G00107890 [Gymnothorax javanicus]|nr:hypothetical protein GJAV_G00107890 [Gymnothorax javanicus]